MQHIRSAAERWHQLTENSEQLSSYLVARPVADVRITANREITLEWWSTRRDFFELFVAELVLAEVSQGRRELTHFTLQSPH
jgi:hypothetical protein